MNEMITAMSSADVVRMHNADVELRMVAMLIGFGFAVLGFCLLRNTQRTTRKPAQLPHEGQAQFPLVDIAGPREADRQRATLSIRYKTVAIVARHMRDGTLFGLFAMILVACAILKPLAVRFQESPARKSRCLHSRGRTGTTCAHPGQLAGDGAPSGTHSSEPPVHEGSVR